MWTELNMILCLRDGGWYGWHWGVLWPLDYATQINWGQIWPWMFVSDVDNFTLGQYIWCKPSWAWFDGWLDDGWLHNSASTDVWEDEEIIQIDDDVILRRKHV